MRILLMLLLLSPTMGQADGKPDFSRLGWLEGCWRGSGLGGLITECWVRSGDDHFTGVFQLERDDQLVFTEIVALADFDGQPAMRVRHFQPDFSQWESDKGGYISFALVAIEDDLVRFKGLEYRFVDNSLHIALDMGSPGKVSTQRFILERLPQGSP